MSLDRFPTPAELAEMSTSEMLYIAPETREYWEAQGWKTIRQSGSELLMYNPNYRHNPDMVP